MPYTAEELMGDAEALLQQHGATDQGFAAVGRLLRRLAQEPELVSHDRLPQLHGSGATATILARGRNGEALMLARFPAEAATPIHNHNSWGVLCVISGRDKHIGWRRLDDGSTAGHAQVARGQERELGPGDILWFGPPPYDIHSQQGIDGAAWELVFFGRDPDAQPRSYFDAESGTVIQRASAG
jgi:predicted metal-dependent enzyme (double-stranded beta helix superfamily)